MSAFNGAPLKRKNGNIFKVTVILFTELKYMSIFIRTIESGANNERSSPYSRMG